MPYSGAPRVFIKAYSNGSTVGVNDLKLLRHTPRIGNRGSQVRFNISQPQFFEHFVACACVTLRSTRNIPDRKALTLFVYKSPASWKLKKPRPPTVAWPTMT